MPTSGIKINELPHASAVAGSNLFPMDNASGTNTEAASAEQIKEYVLFDVMEEIEEKGRETLETIPEDYTSVSNDIKRYNAHDIWDGMLTKANGTSHKVVYTWSGETCTVSTPNGASDGYSANVLLASSALPSSVVPGETYHVKYHATKSGADGVRLRIIFRTADNADISPYLYFEGDGSVTVPANAAKWAVALFVGSGVTLSPAATVGGIHLLNAKTNKELETLTSGLSDDFAKAVSVRGLAPSGTNLDTLKDPGIWLLPSTYSYTHSPFPAGLGGLLTVYPATANSIVQAAYTLSVSSQENVHSYIRAALDGNFGSAWKPIDGIAGNGVLATNTDLDGVKQSGTWALTSGNTYTHSPLPAGYGGILAVFRGTANSVLQMVITLINTGAENMHIYVRTSYEGSFPNAWKPIDGMAGNGVLATNTNLDNVKQSGTWALTSGNTYAHSPLPAGYGGLLTVFRGTANSVVQVVYLLTKTDPNAIRIYVRTSLGGEFVSTWKEIVSGGGGGGSYTNYYTLNHYENSYDIDCSPTITADTNNYLASTGDSTDRTGDIQTMLNTTGVCHLGPGSFYVTGIMVPSYASLFGSGNRTMLRLAESVMDGYAVKLKTYSSVSNMRIIGTAEGSSAPVLTSTVGTRHGILFEGSKVSGQEGGTTEKRSTITECGIINFSGGGIMLTGTGTPVDSNMIISDCFIEHCGAGIYIPYYSEFHRICNCAVTQCWYGTIDNGGNCNFANCDFSENHVGISISASANNSHGTFSGCTVNHSYNDAGVKNKGTAILLEGAALGEIFTGMQIYYGSIVVRDSVGIRFLGANVGWMVPITITGSSVVTFSDCTFAGEPTAADSLFTQSNNTVLKFTDCYLRNGDVYNPMAS